MFIGLKTPPGTCYVPDWQEPGWIPATQENQAARALILHTIMPALLAALPALEAADITHTLVFTAREIDKRTHTATAQDIRIIHHLTKPSFLRHWRKDLTHPSTAATLHPYTILAALGALATLRQIHTATATFCKQYPRQKRKYTRRQPDTQLNLNL